MNSFIQMRLEFSWNQAVSRSEGRISTRIRSFISQRALIVFVLSSDIAIRIQNHHWLILFGDTQHRIKA